MIRRFICFLFLLAGPGLFSQSIDLDFLLVDAATGLPIVDAHLFISDASVGALSDSNGRCQMSAYNQEAQPLVITHVSYETLVLELKDYSTLTDGQQVALISNGIDIHTIEVVANRGSKWKKNFKKFKDVLLGEGKAANKCSILNPDVLRFESKNGVFLTTAVDLIEIENRYLGYNILFWLDELRIEVDGSSQYKGYGSFSELYDDADSLKYQEVREKEYSRSIAYFLCSLRASKTQNQLNQCGFEISIESYKNGQFDIMDEPDTLRLITNDKQPGWSQLRFPEFLTIEHLEVKVPSYKTQKVSISFAEQQKFGSGSTQMVGGATVPAVSRLYKIDPYILFDARGNIVNKSAVKEYGYWAQRRLATTLPVDYKEPMEYPVEQQIDVDTLQLIFDFIGRDKEKRNDAFVYLRDAWDLSYVPPLLDILRLSSDPWQIERVTELLGLYVPEINGDYYSGVRWLWDRDAVYGDYYANFKAIYHRGLDQKFYQYFLERQNQSTIRLDEILWGGVGQDGIPPLRYPKMISATEEDYLSDGDVVFGLVVGDAAYAYPQRILAWHEFFTDNIDGRSIAGVYCTLCGTVIIYDTRANGIDHQLGTSGFLYRSNKLMYDKATQSLWSTVLGKPVLGPLVGKGIELQTLPVVTTTWGDWSTQHPNTRVLSLDTGYERNYDEGEAYKDYYASDALMFPVPRLDSRLDNKARVFVPRSNDYAEDPLALSLDYLKKTRLHQDVIAGKNILILSEKNGSARAYAAKQYRFSSYKKGKLEDVDDDLWIVRDDKLIGPNGETLLRLPAHEAFWFAWYNVFPDTRLVKYN